LKPSTPYCSMRLYTKDFYEFVQQSSSVSAKEVVPLVLPLIRAKRVVDVGCGTGEWLSAFIESGVEDVLGIDGHWIDPALVKIPSARFKQHDLRTPLRLDESFDLVLCLEVAEHLPEAAAGTLVESLTLLAPVVLFSGAIPLQGGVGHLNEQWPDYWAALFLKHRYIAVDCLRRRIWNNPNVACWFAQNLLLFVREDYLQNSELLLEEQAQCAGKPLAMVHPGLYIPKARLAQPRYAIRNLLFLMKQTVKRCLTRPANPSPYDFTERVP